MAGRGLLETVLLTTDFPPQVGGIAEYLAGLWRAAAEWGVTDVYSTVPGGAGNGSRVTTLPPPPDRRLGARIGDGVGFVRRVNTFAYFAASRQYARRTVGPVLRRRDARKRVCIGLWNPLAHFWCDALAASGQEYALFAYGLDVIQPLYGTVAPWRVADFRRAARVITCSTGTGTMVVERLGVDPARVRVVHPGIDPLPNGIPSAATIGALGATLGISGEPVVLSVGRLVRRKGFDLALRAFAAYRGRGGRALYVIAGDGPERGALEALAGELGVREQVRFMGAVDEPTKLALYALCDVFMMPNTLLDNVDWEGFGIVFLEAARAGKPTIGGANGGVPDAIADGVTGILVDPCNQGEVDAALARLLSDSELRARLGAAARERAATQFAWPVIGEKFRRVLEETW